MEDILKRLLNAELKAQEIVNQVKKERDLLINEARNEVLRAEERFNARIPEIYTSFSDKAQERADQVIHELRRRRDERCHKLESEADKRQDKAVKAVLEKLLNVNESQ